MKATELRIGNYIKFKSMIVTINELRGEVGFGADCFNPLRSINQHIDKAEPIPLTEQWLKDFGFDKHTALLIKSFSINISDFESEYKTISVTIEAGNTYIYLRNGELMASRSDDVVIVLFNGDSKGDLFVHQLQNLYFALIGKELVK